MYSNKIMKTEKLDLEFSELLGKTLVKIDKAESDFGLTFTTNENKEYHLYGNDLQCYGCDVSVVIEDIEGDLDDLLNSPLLQAEESIVEDDSWYKLATKNGYVTIRFHGEDGWEYGTHVDFYGFIPYRQTLSDRIELNKNQFLSEFEQLFDCSIGNIFYYQNMNKEQLEFVETKLPVLLESESVSFNKEFDINNKYDDSKGYFRIGYEFCDKTFKKENEVILNYIEIDKFIKSWKLYFREFQKY